MVVGQHDEGGAGRRFAHHLFRHRRQPRLDVGRHAVERVLRASRRRQAAPAAAQVPPPAHGRHGRRRRSARAAAWPHRPSPPSAMPRAWPCRPARSPPRRGRRSTGRSRGRAGCRGVRATSTAALAGEASALRRCRSPCIRAGRRRSCRRSHRAKPASRRPASRGVEPFAFGDLDKAQRRVRRRGRRQAFRGGAHGAIRQDSASLGCGPAQCPSRLGLCSRSTAISTRSGVAGASSRGQILWSATLATAIDSACSTEIASMKRRLADRLGAVDRRLVRSPTSRPASR